MGLVALAMGVLLLGPDPVQAAPLTDDLVLWLKADGDLLVENGRLVVWGDHSERGNDAWAEPGTGPALETQAINGRPAARFDGVRSHLVIDHSPELDATAGFTVACVFRYSGGFRIAQKRSGYGLAPDAWFVSPAEGLGIGGKWGRRIVFPLHRVHLQSSVFDPASRTIRGYNSGKRILTVRDVSPQRPNEDPVYLGQRLNPGGAEGHLQGDLAEILIYNAALSDEARTQVEGYLRVKYDIHPPEKPAIYVTRVIPAHEQVTIEWEDPKGRLAEAAPRFRTEVKLREQPWDDARSVELPPGSRSATVRGLLNHADHELRVLALDVPSGEVLGSSAVRTVTPGWVPGVVIDYLHQHDGAFADRGQYIGSPSITRLDDGALIASHDLFGPGTNDFSRVFRSEDGGETWRWVADVEPAFWGKVFVHRGELHLLATRTRYGDVVLHRSPDGGTTWQGPVIIALGPYHKAPVPVTEHNGRLWTCVELQTGGWPAGFQAVACSVPVDADLMNSTNWTVSEPLAHDPAWLPEGWEIPVEQRGYLEGNAVVDPSGRLLNILRYNTAPYYRKAVVLEIAEDGKSLRFDRLIDFYGGMTKFTIRRHPETKVYWSLVNRVTIPAAAGMRSVLSLVSSPDLIEWTVHGDILRDDSPWAVEYTGFQYVDWLFDGDDIIVASRTAWNGAHNFHDANYLTFHRVKNFAKGVSAIRE